MYPLKPHWSPGLVTVTVPVGGAVVVLVGGVVVVVGVGPEQVGSPLCAGTLTASQAALTVLNAVQSSGNTVLAACRVQVRYFRYEELEVFTSIALYMILAAFWMPRPVTLVLLQVGLVGWPLLGLVPSASR